MLKTLTVWNFALLEHVQIDFDQGLNILTGETGAGKSILIDSLGAILGQRLSVDAIRSGCDGLRIEAVFLLEDGLRQKLHQILEEQAIEEDDGELIITRQLSRSGRSSVLVNGCHVTLAVLKQLGRELVDIHGQNENLALLREANHFDLLDQSDGKIEEILGDYQQIYQEWSAKRKRLDEKQAASREYAQRLDMLRWQDKEIEDAHLKEGEEEDLEADIRRMSHAEKIADYVEESYRLMDGGMGDAGILPSLAKIRKNLEDMSRFDNGLENARKMLEDAAVMLQEAAYEIRDYGESMEFEPQKLDMLQKRMDIIYRLCKKYGSTTTEVLDHQKKVRQELTEIENYDEDIARLQKEIHQAETHLSECAGRLTEARKKGALQLSGAIEQQLKSLGMPQARFSIELHPLEDYAANGKDALAMNFSANPGETPKPLQKVASGGELSRIALAIKTISAAKQDAVPSMVFDEIDTGIGGRTAQMVAERIALVAKYRQVLCITHLPQIACMADVHLYIAKNSKAGKTATSVHRLTETEEINEIARMASGVDVTAASLDNAREMVLHARMTKSRLAV